MNLHAVPVAILAGGLATRLGPLTAQTPKALLPVAGRPFVDHQLALLRRRGCRRVVLCLGHFGEQVVRHVGSGERYGLEVTYSHDGERLLGTGGALRRAAPMLGDLCWVLYGDSYLDFDYAAVLDGFSSRPEPALMTVYANHGRWDHSNVLFRDGRIVRYDKRTPSPDMVHIDYGAGLLRAEALERLPADRPSDLAELYAALAAEGRLAGYEMAERFYEIGSEAGLRELDRLLLEASRSDAAGARS